MRGQDLLHWNSFVASAQAPEQDVAAACLRRGMSEFLKEAQARYEQAKKKQAEEVASGGEAGGSTTSGEEDTANGIRHTPQGADGESAGVQPPAG